jgi:hypothetical protein
MRSYAQRLPLRVLMTKPVLLFSKSLGRRAVCVGLTLALAVCTASDSAAQGRGLANARHLLQTLIEAGGDDAIRAGRVLYSLATEGEQAAGRLAWQEAAQARSELRPGSFRVAEALEEVGRWLGIGTRDAAGLTSPSLLLDAIRTLPNVQRTNFPLQFQPGPVVDFVTTMDEGARDPEFGFSRAPQWYRGQIERWRRASREMRIAVLGSGDDVGLLRELVSRWESLGYVVFFYEFCQTVGGVLCPPETVGAFSGTAGTVLLMDTAAGRVSKFVAPEVAAVIRARAGTPRALYLTPGRAALGGAAFFAVLGQKSD